MQLLSNFDIQSDFWSDPQLKTIFSQEYKSKTPSKIMWALMLYIHPDSKYYSLDEQSRLSLIIKDYAKELDITKHQSTIEKIKTLLLTKAQRSLVNWEQKLEERDAFIANIQYSESTYELLDKMMASTSKMWDQYLAILKKVEAEEDSHSQGDVELSLKERGVIN